MFDICLTQSQLWGRGTTNSVQMTGIIAKSLTLSYKCTASEQVPIHTRMTTYNGELITTISSSHIQAVLQSTEHYLMTTIAPDYQLGPHYKMHTIYIQLTHGQVKVNDDTRVPLEEMISPWNTANDIRWRFKLLY